MSPAVAPVFAYIKSLSWGGGEGCTCHPGVPRADCSQTFQVIHLGPYRWGYRLEGGIVMERGAGGVPSDWLKVVRGLGRPPALSPGRSFKQAFMWRALQPLSLIELEKLQAPFLSGDPLASLLIAFIEAIVRGCLRGDRTLRGRRLSQHRCKNGGTKRLSHRRGGDRARLKGIHVLDGASQQKLFRLQIADKCRKCFLEPKDLFHVTGGETEACPQDAKGRCRSVRRPGPEPQISDVGSRLLSPRAPLPVCKTPGERALGLGYIWLFA